MTAARLAIFVGGKSARMGRPKGALRLPGGGPTILEHLASLGQAEGLAPFLVGAAADYDHLVLSLDRVDDDPRDGGPLAGLRAALRFTAGSSVPRLIAVACDMPYVSAEALRLLRDSPSEAPVLAPRRANDAPWEPMLARYDVAGMLPVLDAALGRGVRSFQRLFTLAGAEAPEWHPSFAAALRDWDAPRDVVP